jgi:putative endonuclease
MSGDPRRALGSLGESLAARHMEARGYEVIDRNFRTRYGELDLIARDRRWLVFCEVKTRIAYAAPSPYSPFASVGVRKRRQIRAMAREWLAANASTEGPRPPQLRFDAIGIRFDARGRLIELDHMEDAF